MEQNTTPKRDPARLLASILVIFFGLWNIFNGLLPLLVGGSTRLLENWGFILMTGLGLLMIFAGIIGALGKLQKAWKGFGYGMLFASVALLVTMLFLRGIMGMYAFLLNLVAAVAYLAKVK